MTKGWIRTLSLVVVFVTMGALLRAALQKAEPSGKQMQIAASKFLEVLTPEQKKESTFAFDDAERLNWHFIPRDRKGVQLRQLTKEQQAQALALIATGLSPTGYEQALAVMSLEEVLYLLEEGERDFRRERRDPKKYHLSIFGTPGPTGKWGWRLEGHHLSLNYTLENGEVISSTPEFFGANPAVINAGPGRAIRVLATEEDLARQIYKLCTPEQAKATLRGDKAPNDLRGANIAQPDNTPAEGLLAGQMTADQKKLLQQLLAEYLKNMPEDVAAGREKRLREAGFDKIAFAWWGQPDRDQPHYYRVQGPTFLIEYNNTQNSANHVHSYWRDLGGDFGIPLKK